MFKPIKNRRAQVGEVLEDFPAFVVIAFMLLLMILLSVLFYGNGAKDAQEQANYAIARDKMNILLYSMMQEKQSDTSTFSDLIRNKSQSTQDRLQKEINGICDELNTKTHGRLYSCYVDIYYDNALEECKKNPGGTDETFCFFVPGNDIISIKVTTVWVKVMG